jgi:hypothetical protein
VTGDPPGTGDLLLVSGHRWLNVCRLALAAREAGFAPHLLGPRKHPIASLPWLRTAGDLAALWPARSIARALAEREYDLVVPTDDVAAAAVFEAHRRGLLDARGRRVVERSLGDPRSFGIRHSRAAIGGVALSAGVVAPLTLPVPDVAALGPAAERVGFPAVLKTDGSCAGMSVALVRDPAEAEAAFHRLAAPPRIAESIGRQVLDHDPSYLGPALRRQASPVSIQRYVAGTQMTLTVAAWRGEVIGAVGFRAISSRPGNGPATVVEPVSHPDMDFAAEALARELGLSGLFGLDFIVSPDGTTASLIELNPRATPTAHLAPARSGAPLLERLAARLERRLPRATGTVPAGPIELFPRLGPEELGPAPGDAYLDLPPDADVVELCRAMTQPHSAPLAELIRRVF